MILEVLEKVIQRNCPFQCINTVRRGMVTGTAEQKIAKLQKNSQVRVMTVFGFWLASYVHKTIALDQCVRSLFPKMRQKVSSIVTKLWTLILHDWDPYLWLPPLHELGNDLKSATRQKWSQTSEYWWRYRCLSEEAAWSLEDHTCTSFQDVNGRDCV